LEATRIGIPGFLAKLKTADGNQAWVLYLYAANGWLSEDTAVALIKTVPGDRAMELYRCAYQDWLTYEEVETYLETR
jgi:hypothetical protein